VTEGSLEGVGTSIRPGAAPTAEVTGTVSPSSSDGYILRAVAFCAICFESDWEDRMVTCRCNLSYHFECLKLNIRPPPE
jgi:hypothetical protein